MKLILLFCLLAVEPLLGGLECFFKEATGKIECQQMRNIDFIYMINLDERPEKFATSAEQLADYGIVPYRFSAVNGWQLPITTINALGTPYDPSMKKAWGTFYFLQGDGSIGFAHEIMGTSNGKIYFCHCMARGTIGIVLSHLSILHDAYKAGYTTVLIMEDDIQIIRNPHLLSDRIDELDAIVGKEGWDILFSDRDTRGQNGQYVPCTSCAWRPGCPLFPSDRFFQRYTISRNLRRIGARYGAYSMVVRRSGMKKILDFFNTHQIFLPFDMEYTLPKDIKLFTVIDDIISTLPKALSDNSAPNYLY